MNDAMDSLAAALQRARHAKQHELAAHERAARLHEQAAELQARLGHQDRAEQARQYAALARERIALARAGAIAASYGWAAVPARGGLANEARVALDGPHPSPELLPPAPGAQRGRPHRPCHLHAIPSKASPVRHGHSRSLTRPCPYYSPAQLPDGDDHVRRSSAR